MSMIMTSPHCLNEVHWACRRDACDCPCHADAEPEDDAALFPPRVLWGREMGWLNVRDPWGQWHAIPAKEAPRGWARLAQKAKYGY